MKNNRGEIATILTLGVLAVIGVTTIISSIFLTSNKKTNTNTRADEPTCAAQQIAPDNWVLDCNNTCNRSVGGEIYSKAVADRVNVNDPAVYGDYVNSYCKSHYYASQGQAWCIGYGGQDYCMRYMAGAKAGKAPSSSSSSTTSSGSSTDMTFANFGKVGDTVSYAQSWTAVKDNNGNKVTCALTANDSNRKDAQGRPYGSEQCGQKLNTDPANTWCFGFTDGMACLQLKSNLNYAPTPLPTATPVPIATKAPAATTAPPQSPNKPGNPTPTTPVARANPTTPPTSGGSTGSTGSSGSQEPTPSNTRQCVDGYYDDGNPNICTGCSGKTYAKGAGACDSVTSGYFCLHPELTEDAQWSSNFSCPGTNSSSSCTASGDYTGCGPRPAAGSTTPTTAPDPCTTSKNEPNGCGCGSSSECASGYCKASSYYGGTCADQTSGSNPPPAAPTSPSTTNTPQPTSQFIGGDGSLTFRLTNNCVNSQSNQCQLNARFDQIDQKCTNKLGCDSSAFEAYVCYDAPGSSNVTDCDKVSFFSKHLDIISQVDTSLNSLSYIRFPSRGKIPTFLKTANGWTAINPSWNTSSFYVKGAGDVYLYFVKQEPQKYTIPPLASTTSMHSSLVFTLSDFCAFAPNMFQCKLSDLLDKAIGNCDNRTCAFGDNNQNAPFVCYHPSPFYNDVCDRVSYLSKQQLGGKDTFVIEFPARNARSAPTEGMRGMPNIIRVDNYDARFFDFDPDNRVSNTQYDANMKPQLVIGRNTDGTSSTAVTNNPQEGVMSIDPSCDPTVSACEIKGYAQ